MKLSQDYKGSKVVNSLFGIYLILAICFYGVQGKTFIPQIFGLFVAGTFLLDIIIFNRKVFYSFPIFLLILFGLYTLLGTIWYSTSWSFFFTIFQITFLFLLLYNILIEVEYIERFYWSFIVGIILLVVIQLFNGRPLLFTELEDLYRVGGNVGNSNDYAFCLLVGINFLTLMLLGKNDNQLIKVFVSLLIIIFLYEIIFFSGSKSGFIIASFSLFCYLIFKFQAANKTVRLLLLTIIIGPVIYFIKNANEFNIIIFQRFERMFNFFLGRRIGKYDRDHSSEERYELILDGLRLWAERPLFGWGPNEFRYINNVAYDTYSHNNYIEILVNFGLLGFVLFYSIHLYIIVRIWKLNLISKSNNLKWLLVIVISLLFVDMTFVTYYNKIYFICIGLVLVLVERPSVNAKSY